MSGTRLGKLSSPCLILGKILTAGFQSLELFIPFAALLGIFSSECIAGSDLLGTYGNAVFRGSNQGPLVILGRHFDLVFRGQPVPVFALTIPGPFNPFYWINLGEIDLHPTGRLRRNPTSGVSIFAVIDMLQLVKSMFKIAIGRGLGSKAGEGDILAVGEDFQLVDTGLTVIGLQNRETYLLGGDRGKVFHVMEVRHRRSQGRRHHRFVIRYGLKENHIRRDGSTGFATDQHQ